MNDFDGSPMQKFNTNDKIVHHGALKSGSERAF